MCVGVMCGVEKSQKKRNFYKKLNHLVDMLLGNSCCIYLQRAEKFNIYLYMNGEEKEEEHYFVLVSLGVGNCCFEE